MEVKIFWQASCPTCPQAKALGAELEAAGKKVGYYNIKEPDGLTEGVMYDVMSTPSVIVADDSGEEVASFRTEVPNIEDVNKVF